MISAFGVDHGQSDQIEKLANPVRALRTFGGAIGSGTSRMGQGLSSRSANLGAKLRTRPGVATMRRSAGVSAAGAGQRGGGALNRFGGAMTRRPGLTGGLATGGTTAGVGATGMAIGQRRKQPGHL
jgi:hypothetical protein